MLTTSRSPSSSRCRRVKVNVTKVHESERLALAARLRHHVAAVHVMRRTACTVRAGGEPVVRVTASVLNLPGDSREMSVFDFILEWDGRVGDDLIV